MNDQKNQSSNPTAKELRNEFSVLAYLFLTHTGSLIKLKRRLYLRALILWTFSGLDLILMIIFTMPAVLFWLTLLFCLTLGVWGTVTYYKYRNLHLDLNVTKIGKVHWQGLVIPFESGNTLVDLCQLLPRKDFRFPLLPHFDQLQKTFNQLQKVLRKYPEILPSTPFSWIPIDSEKHEQFRLFSEEDKVRQLLKKTSEILSSVEHWQESLAVADKNSLLWQGIKEYTNNQSVTSLLLKDTLENIMERFGRLRGISSDHEEDLEEYFKQLKELLLQYQQRINKLQELSILDILGSYITEINNLICYSGFEFYCPSCNQEILQKLGKMSAREWEPLFVKRSAKMKFVPEKRVWLCPLCEQETNMPIPLHKLFGDVFLPTYDQLMEENRTNRQQIYNDIGNQKLQYHEKTQSECETLFQKNRSDAEAIESKLRELDAHIQGDFKAIKLFRDVMTKYHEMVRRRIAEMSDFTQELVQKITEENDTFVLQFREYTAQLNRQLSSELQRLATLAQEEQKQRDAYLRETVERLKHIERSTKVGTAVQAAMAKKAGLFKPPAWRVDKMVKYKLTEIGARMTGKTGVEEGAVKAEQMN